MAPRVVTCACGQQMRLPERAVSGRGRCIRCGALIRIKTETPQADKLPPAPSPESFESDDPITEAPPATEETLPRHPAYADLTPPPRDARMERLEALWGDETPELAAQAGQAGPIRPPVTVPRDIAAAVSVSQCARCGRAFRGDWDQHAGEEGTLCTICARQSPEPTPWDPPSGGPTIAPPSKAELREMRSVQERLEREKQPRKERRGLVPFLIFAGVVMLLILVLPVEDWLGRAAMEMKEHPPEAIDRWWGWPLRVVSLLLVFLSYYIPVYLTFKESGRLDFDSFLSNALYTSKYALGFFIVEVFIGSFGGLGGPIPLMALVVTFKLLIPPLILWAFVGFSGREIFHLYVFLWITALMVWMLERLLTGGIAVLAQ